MAFTVDNTNFQTASKIEELRLGYSERQKAAGGSFYRWLSGSGAWQSGFNTAVAAGDDIQHYKFYSQMQTFCQNSCTSFLDTDPGSSTASFDLFSSFQDFCSVIGGDMYTSGADYGFRRSTDGTTFSRGVMQAGDIIGAWIFEDLISCFNKMSKTLVFPSNNTSQAYTGTGDDASYATAKTEAGTGWGTGGTGEVETKVVYTTGPDNFAVTANGLDLKLEVSNTDAGNEIGGTVAFYAEIWNSDDIFGTYYDNGLGYTENEYNLVSSGHTWNSTTDAISDQVASGSTYSAIIWPSEPVSAGTYIRGFQVAGSRAVITWSFTN